MSNPPASSEMDRAVALVAVASWGGGVNSTAMLIEWLRRGERLDLVLFADTGGEKPETYAYRDTFFAWMKTRTAAPCITVQHNGRDPSLEAEVLRIKGLPSIAYGVKRCSQKWKRGPQDVFVNNWEPAREAWARGEKVAKLIGFDAGEAHRATRIPPEDSKYRYRYPLIEFGLGREECVEAIEASGLPVPPKSSCFFCPSTRVPEILRLRDEHPDLMKRALAMEANAELRPSSGPKGLGRRFSWRALLKRERLQKKLWTVPAVPCDCFDGEEEEAVAARSQAENAAPGAGEGRDG